MNKKGMMQKINDAIEDGLDEINIVVTEKHSYTNEEGIVKTSEEEKEMNLLDYLEEQGVDLDFSQVAESIYASIKEAITKDCVWTFESSMLSKEDGLELVCSECGRPHGNFLHSKGQTKDSFSILKEGKKIIDIDEL